MKLTSSRRIVHPRPGLRVANITHPGEVRSNNEDSFGYFEHEDDELFAQRGRVAVVADGMGGQAAGEVASKITVRMLRDAYMGDGFADLPPHEAVVRTIRRANRRIHEESERDDEKHGMGTTVTALVVLDRTAWAVHVGDSRVYLWRNNVLRQVTEDHSSVWELIKAGYISSEALKNHPLSSAIYRSLGSSEDVDVDVEGPIELQEGDRILLCSDGLTDMVDDEAIAQQLELGSPSQACRNLVKMARAAGGRDNITITIFSVEDPRPPAEEPSPRPAARSEAETAPPKGLRRFLHKMGLTKNR